MNALVCEMCQSNELVKENGMYVCQHCGTKYTVEEARKLLGSVKIDKSEEIEKLLSLARRARDDNNSVNAEKYYAAVLLEEPNNWEASFFQLYFSCVQRKLIEIEHTTKLFINSLASNIDLALKLSDGNEREAAVITIIAYSDMFAHLIATAAVEHAKEFDTPGIIKERNNRVFLAESIYINLISFFKQKFPSDHSYVAVTLRHQEHYYSKYAVCYPLRSTKYDEILQEIEKYDPEYREKLRQDAIKASESQKGCYVATAVYGSYDCPEVWTLRRYRDNTLAETWYGRAFIHTYYAISPTLVKWFGDTSWFKKLWKGKLDRIVKNLQAQGYDSTPYEDKKW